MYLTICTRVIAPFSKSNPIRSGKLEIDLETQTPAEKILPHDPAVSSNNVIGC